MVYCDNKSWEFVLPVRVKNGSRFAISFSLAEPGMSLGLYGLVIQGLIVSIQLTCLIMIIVYGILTALP